ncbi:MAG: MGH1-like glycoside hydrolase domain-containing protein [Solirubrobacteraceae bacterium]
MDATPVRAVCEATLRRDWRKGVRHSDGLPFAYTCPSPHHYPWQWYWDSCFAAIVWRRFDTARLRRELESLLSVQHDDGFIGHTIFWNTPLRGLRRYTYNVISRDAEMTSSIQPPVLAWAWSIAVGDPVADPRIARHYDWLAEHRDLDGDGLIWIVQPDESGLDASPQFDVIWGRRAHGLPESRCWWRATAASATTCGGSPP